MNDDDNSLPSVPSYFRDGKSTKKFSRKTLLANTSAADAAAEYDKPATKKPKSEERGLFSDEKMKSEEPSFYGRVQENLVLPPRPESSENTSSPSKNTLLQNKNMLSTPKSTGLVGKKPNNQIEESPGTDSQVSGVSEYSNTTGLTGLLTDKTPYSEKTASFSEMQKEMQKEMERQKSKIEEWKELIDSAIVSINSLRSGASSDMKSLLNEKRKSFKSIKKKLDDTNIDFQNKQNVMDVYYFSKQANDSSDTNSGNESSQEETKPDSESDSEPTPDAIKDFTKNLQELHDEVDKSENSLKKETLESNLNRMNDQLTELLNQEEITAKNLEALFDPTKMDCEENDDDCSFLTITTGMLMNEETLSKLRGNKTVEDSKNRNRNVNNIIEIMYKNAIHKKIHTEYGVKKSNRDTIERYMGTDSQFMNVWGGANQTIEKSEWAKEKCCYLCQGLNVYKDGITSPEMEHKLPSLEFYTKVHNINEYYPELLQKWRQYVDNNLKSIQALYSYINCSTGNWATAKNLLGTKLKNYLKTFQDENSSDEDINKFIALLKVYLMEFAYSHHTCNQMKENSNLNDPKTRDIYIKSVKVAIQKGSYTSQPLLKPVKLLAERSNIIMDDKNFDNIGGHMSLINDYIEEYALLLYKDEARENGKKTLNTITEYCLKKIMLQSLKSTVNFLIEYKNKEKRKNAKRMKNNQSEKYIDMLDVLDDLKEVFDEYKGKQGRAKTNYRKRVHQDAYSKSNKYNLFLDKVYNLDDNNIVKNLILYGKTDDIKDDDKKLEDMEIDDMYNNLTNSDRFLTLLAEYKKGVEYQNLSNYLNKYVSKEGGKNKTKKNKPKNETRRIKIKSNRKTRRRRSNNKSKKQK